MENQKESLNTKAKGTKFSRTHRNVIITSLVQLYVFEKESFIRLPKLGLVKFAKSKDIKGKIFLLQSEELLLENILFQS